LKSPQKDKAPFYDFLLSDPDLRLFLYHLYFLGNPCRIDFLSDLAGAKFQLLFKQLVIEGDLLPGAECKVYFVDQDLFSRLGKEVRALPEKQQRKLAEKMMSIYEKMKRPSLLRKKLL